MKKRILNFGFTCLSVLILASCQKTNTKTLPVPEPKEEIGETKSAQGKPKPDPTINGCYTEKRLFCFEMVPCNCTVLKEIIVTPHFTERIRTASENGNPTLVSGIFNDMAHANVFDRLVPDQLDSLRSGRYYLHIQNEDATRICVFAGPHFPLTEGNFAFVFQYNK